MVLYAGERGRILRFADGGRKFSDNELILNFTRPDGTEFQKTGKSVNPVTLPGVDIVDPDIGPLKAKTYLEFSTVKSDFDMAGLWKICGEYEGAKKSSFIVGE